MVVSDIRQPTIVGVLGVALVFIAGGSQPATAADPLEDLDAYVEQVLVDWDLPGLAVAVVSGDEPLSANVSETSRSTARSE